MFKFLLIVSIASFVSADPTYPIVGYGYGVPTANSYSSRVDYNTPVVAKTLVTAPVVPAYAYGIPSATSYSSRVDYHTPAIAKTVVSAPVYGYGAHYGSGLGYSYGSVEYPYGSGLYYGNSLGYGNHGYGYGFHYWTK